MCFKSWRIGLTIASLLAREAAIVIINGRSRARLNAAIRRIGGGHSKSNGYQRVRGVVADLATARGVEEFVRQVPRAIFSSTTSASSNPSHSRKSATSIGSAIFVSAVFSKSDLLALLCSRRVPMSDEQVCPRSDFAAPFRHSGSFAATNQTASPNDIQRFLA